MSAAVMLCLARATVFAVVCLGLGVLGHLLGGGSVSPHVAVLAAGIALAAALPVTGRERGMAVVLPLLAGVQAVLHVVFSTAPLITPLAGTAGTHAHSELVPGLGMVVTHGWAMVLSALWLSRGEAALWATLRRLAVRLLPVVFVLLAHPPPRLGRARDRAPAPRRPAPLRHTVIGRAPPRFTAA
ncbi:MFS transporter [Sphaerisporangium sp. NPDC051011]|uniref:MFS transporter n=1 Tax=Sphaerisporangium sp. NPDC051011 TaxID=3155792 RepID=UPI0033C0BCC4